MKEKEGLFKPDNVALEQPAKEAVLLINLIFGNDRAIDGEASAAQRLSSRSSGDQAILASVEVRIWNSSRSCWRQPLEMASSVHVQQARRPRPAVIESGASVPLLMRTGSLWASIVQAQLTALDAEDHRILRAVGGDEDALDRALRRCRDCPAEADPSVEEAHALRSIGGRKGRLSFIEMIHTGLLKLKPFDEAKLMVMSIGIDRLGLCYGNLGNS